MHKSYTQSTRPNYAPNTAPPTDSSSLTDGIFTDGYFWAERSTVGWDKKPVTITIDLEKLQTVGEVTFNTARNIKAEVYFPQNVFLFVSDNDKNYRYVGDLANSRENQQGTYLVKKFSLNKLKVVARFISLVIIPKGNYIFCDEIEVMKGSGSLSPMKMLIPKASLIDAVDSLKLLEFEIKNLARVFDNLKSISTIKNLTAKFNSIGSKMNSMNQSPDDIKELRESIHSNYATFLRGTYNTSFILEKYNPWADSTEFYKPTESVSSLNYSFNVADKGVEYGAFMLTNTQSSDKDFNFEIRNTDSSIFDLQLFNVIYVPSSDFAQVADPLIPIKDKITMQPGISKMVLFKIAGKKSGSSESKILVQSGTRQVLLNISTTVLPKFNNSDQNNLNANNFAYLNLPMLERRPEEAVKDLFAHHINTIDVPPSFLPQFNSNDYKPFLDYISYFKGVKNILLFTNYSSNENFNNSGKFMSLSWKRDFIVWYRNLVKVIKENGFSGSKIYLFPYDEVHGTIIEDFKNFAIWVKSALPEIKLYATLSTKDAVHNILPLVDVGQIYEEVNLLGNLPKHNAEIWLYNVYQNARSLSPYTSYRLMAWRAFLNEATGIGFWNYADEDRDEILNLFWQPLLNPARSYSVIYNGPLKEIVSSRRWEAFKLGIEDYSFLQQYAKKYSLDKAKNLASKVINYPDSVSLADEVRNTIIEQLR
ncbi:MAG: hypothetical protein ABIP35_01015 [Ginsengibacter sp.]